MNDYLKLHKIYLRHDFKPARDSSSHRLVSNSNRRATNSNMISAKGPDRYTVEFYKLQQEYDAAKARYEKAEKALNDYVARNTARGRLA